METQQNDGDGGEDTEIRDSDEIEIPEETGMSETESHQQHEETHLHGEIPRMEKVVKPVASSMKVGEVCKVVSFYVYSTSDV